MLSILAGVIAPYTFPNLQHESSYVLIISFYYENRAFFCFLVHSLRFLNNNLDTFALIYTCLRSHIELW